MSAIKAESTSSLRSFVDTLLNLLRTLNSYCHRADLKAAANMRQVMRKPPQAISERCSSKKLELQPKEADLTDVDKWLETRTQVKEMAFGCYNTSKQNSDRSKWLKKQKDPFATSGSNPEYLICKEEHEITLFENLEKGSRERLLGISEEV